MISRYDWIDLAAVDAAIKILWPRMDTRDIATSIRVPESVVANRLAVVRDQAYAIGRAS